MVEAGFIDEDAIGAPVETETVAEPESVAPDVAAEADDDDDFDEEIVEIFTEEAEEVFEAVAEFWPQYAADISNQDALSEVRRAFHTLKGSGRMVEAVDIGELGWAVEDILNRLIDNSISYSAGMNTLLVDVQAVLPALLQSFANRTQHEVDVAALMARANAIAAGEVVEAEAAETDAVETVDEPAAQVADAATDPANAETFEALSPDDIALPEATEEPEVDTAEAIAASAEESAIEGLADVFIKEATDHLALIAEFVTAANNETQAVPDSLYRAWHTLKGSAQLSGFTAMGDLVSGGELLVRQAREHGRDADAEFVAVIAAGAELVQLGLQQLATPDEPIAGADAWLEQAIALAAQQGEAEQATPLSQFLATQADTVLELADVFEQWQDNPDTETGQYTELTNGWFGLKTAAAEFAVAPTAQLAEQVSAVLEQLAVTEAPANPALLAAMNGAHTVLTEQFDRYAAGQDADEVGDLTALLHAALADAIAEYEEAKASEQAAAEQAAAEAAATEVATPVAAAPVSSEEQPWENGEYDAEMMEIFLEEAFEIMDTVAVAKDRWMADIADLAPVVELQRGLHTIKGGARMAGINAMGDLSHELETLYEKINDNELTASAELFELLHACDDRLVEMLNDLQANSNCRVAHDLIARLHQFLGTKTQAVAVVVEDDISDAAEVAGDEKVTFDTAIGSTVEAHAGDLSAFFEEAAGLVARLADEVKAIGDKRRSKNKVTPASLKTIVAELQEASYVAGINEIGDLCQMCAEVAGGFNQKQLTAKKNRDELQDWVERISTSVAEAKAGAVGAATEDAKSSETGSAKLTQLDLATDTRPVTNENVRVSSNLLEQLVNLAGETSVARARVEQQFTYVGYAVDEFDGTIERLREQLRQMDRETEAQILFRTEQKEFEHEGFDPLEFDRYTRMQELSRALGESVSDLTDVKDTLRDRSRYTETLLLQQSRINSELQEGLMKTRMEPFSKVVPRLRRIVRQVASELGKKVDLQFQHAETELDRNLLERVTAPLEHMIRNAVDHGIEVPQVRGKASKAETGQIMMSLSRDGGDVVLELRDDGAGIDVNVIRNKAIERGLMKADAELSDFEILQFIFQAGFSTAEKVTQISGRGVGMDVVRSEIKQLGGSVSIDSEQGQGTSFTIRLPFTVALNRALLVNVGGTPYALPLNTIEGVVRVSPYELEEYYREDGPDFEYAGRNYDLRYLGEYLGSKGHQIQGTEPLPVILVRAGDKPTAIQVDDITGSREVVVKPLGRQFNSMGGMSGATILGDGRVVLILDMPAMVRTSAAMQSRSAVTVDTSAQADSGKVKVLVVDDSVTVRKVASRVLQRNGFDVEVAKDGVDALTKLQDFIPDVILLDIEMPRMDGFEFATRVRHDDRVQNVPIIMITSRTGDKHRERAEGIGVNEFMGKPFQEEELLNAIDVQVEKALKA